MASGIRDTGNCRYCKFRAIGTANVHLWVGVDRDASAFGLRGSRHRRLNSLDFKISAEHDVIE